MVGQISNTELSFLTWHVSRNINYFLFNTFLISQLNIFKIPLYICIYLYLHLIVLIYCNIFVIQPLVLEEFILLYIGPCQHSLQFVTFNESIDGYLKNIFLCILLTIVSVIVDQLVIIVVFEVIKQLWHI